MKKSYSLPIFFIIMLASLLPLNAGFNKVNEPNQIGVKTLSFGPNGEMYCMMSDGGINYSKDSGATWKYIVPDTLYPISVFVARNCDIYFINATRNELYKSRDTGNTWSKIPLPYNTVPPAFAADTAGNVFLAYYGEIWRYSADSNKLTKVHFKTWLNPTKVIITKYNRIFVLTYSGGAQISSNAGVSWYDNSWGFRDAKFMNDTTLISDYSGGYYILTGKDTLWTKYCEIGYYYMNKSLWTVDPAGNFYIQHKNGRLFYSSDKGLTWNEIKNFNRKNKIYTMESNKARRLYLATELEGVIYTDDFGETWHRLNMKSHTINIFQATTIGDSTVIGATVDSKVFASKNRCEEWDMYNIFEGTFPSILETNSKGDIFLVNSIGPFRCNAGSKMFNMINYMLDYAVNDFSFIDTTNIIAATSGGLYNSSDNGNTWTRCLMADYEELYLPFTSCAITETKAYAGTIDSGLYVADINNLEWSKLWQPDEDLLTINDIAFVGEVVYLATNKGIYRSTESIHDFEKIDNTELGNISKLLLFGEKDLFAVSDKLGIIRSADGFDTWSGFNEGLPEENPVVSVSIDTKGYMYVTTKTGGMYRTEEALITGVEEKEHKTASLNIIPNPASDYLKIEMEDIDESEPSNLKVYIYNITGTRIPLSMILTYNNGKLIISINTENLRSGTYMVSVCTTKTIINRMFIVNK